MKRIFAASFLLTVTLTIRTSAGEAWIVERHHGFSAIRSQQSAKHKEPPSLDELLATVDSLKNKTELPLRHISFTAFFRGDTTVQTELLRQFEVDYPELLRNALASSGNMHNPRILPLRDKFSDALLKTPTLIKIERRMNSIGYTISSVSHEKFSISKSSDPCIFHALVTLTLSAKKERDNTVSPHPTH
jgi:hypothetical protein